MNKRIIVAAVAALAMSAALVPASASLADAGHNPVIVPGTPQPRSTGGREVFQIDVDSAGTVFGAAVSSGLISRIPATGAPTTLATNSLKTTLTSVIAQRNGVVYYTTTAAKTVASDRDPVVVMSVPATGGTPKLVADLGAWEKSHNPDAKNTYGYVGLPKDCSDQFLVHREAVRHGSYFYNPSSMIATASGLYITDAGRSSVLRVGYDGSISLVAVLPPQAQIVADIAVRFQYSAPNCADGYKFIPEGAPTGITLAPDGNLYVTVIPANNPYLNDTFAGGLYRVNPTTGATTRIIGKLFGPSGVSATPSGTLYISEIRGGAGGNPTGGGGGISVVRVNAQVARPVINTDSPWTVKFVKDKLYVSGSSGLSVIPLTYK